MKVHSSSFNHGQLDTAKQQHCAVFCLFSQSRCFDAVDLRESIFYSSGNDMTSLVPARDNHDS